MSARVREDQHGTTTGYAYGCRCVQCAAARREYDRGNGRESRVSDDTLELVLQALQHEADLDGLSTASAERLGELAAISRSAAGWAVHRLAEKGRVQLVGRAGRGGALVVQLPQEQP